MSLPTIRMCTLSLVHTRCIHRCGQRRRRQSLRHEQRVAKRTFEEFVDIIVLQYPPFYKLLIPARFPH